MEVQESIEMLVMAAELATRLKLREPAFDLQEPLWQARLWLAWKWWKCRRDFYDQQFINEFGSDLLTRTKNVQKVTKEFAEWMINQQEQAKLAVMFIYSGPSGVGKTTIWAWLRDLFPNRFEKVVMATTRPPRPGEVDGRENDFVSAEELKADATANPIVACVLDQSL